MRWNSTYLMIDRAIQKQDKLSSFILRLNLEPDPSRRLPAADILTSDDWKVLIEIRTILEPLYRMTMKTQGWGLGSKQGWL
jgi:hypothetical protein